MVAFSVLGLLLVPAAARASDRPAGQPQSQQPPQQADARTRIRELLVMNRVADATVVIADRLNADVSPAERAALIELYAVAEAWKAGKPMSQYPSEDLTGEIPWGKGLALARTDIESGSFDRAARRLDVLLPLAPDLIEASRAGELRSLARDLVRAETSVPLTTLKASPSSSSSGSNDDEELDDDKTKRRRAKKERKQKEKVEYRGEWYGWQTLLVDGAAVGTAFLSPWVGGGIYLAGAPIIHGAHANYGRAGLSAGLRVAAPFGGGLIGITVRQVAGCETTFNSCLNNTVTAMLIGAGAGMVVMMAADAIFLAREKSEPKANVTGREKSALSTIRPSAGPRKDGGFDVGIGGTF